MHDLSTRPTPRKIVMIPSVGGGIGHIARTGALARALLRLDPQLEVEYLLDTDRLRPFNIDACRQMGFRPRFLPPRNRENRDAIVRACLDDADVIVDDCSRYLQPLHRSVPQAAWVSIPMHPVADELFMDWPFMAQMDVVFWAYTPVVEVPSELDAVAGRLVRTGPFLETADVPDQATARRRLGLRPHGPHVVYAPRGFPFGQEFGHRVLASVYGAVELLRAADYPNLELVLLSVSDRGGLRGIADVPEELPDWVRIEGLVSPAMSLLHTRAADIVIGEGTSTMHEGAALRTPLVLMPGPIREAEMTAFGLTKAGAARSFRPSETVPEQIAAAFRSALLAGPERNASLDKAFRLVTGGGGAEAAARRVLTLIGERAAIGAVRDARPGYRQ